MIVIDRVHSNLKTDVTDPTGTTPDEQKGMYSQRVSAYGGYKLREVVRSIVSLRNTNAGDEEKKFRLFINDGSLPFGGSFSPHQTHNNGNVLDIRPLGNTGQSENHYDFARGTRRLNDVAALWAESTHRYLSCRHIPEEDEARETCETTMRAQFVAAFDAINTRKFTTSESELKRWIELNQQLKNLHLRTMQSLWLPYLHYKSLRDQARPTLQQQEIRYFTFGDEIGFDNDQLQSASWRKYLMPDSTNYRVVAKFRIGNSTKSIEVPFSSAGMRGTYVSNIHADPFPPMNPFTVPGLEMKELQFEFPANAVGIEFEVRSVGTQQEYSREYIPESSGRIAAGHSSIVYKQSSASCKLAPPGYTVRQVYYDIERLEPQPGPIEGNWHHDSFINWPQSISVESILRENSSLTNKRFFTYAAQSLMTENRFVPIDLDKLAVEHGNPLEYIFSGSYRRVTTLPSAAELNIPVRVVVSHFGFDQPTSVQVRGVYNGNTVVLKSIGLRDGLVSRPDLSIYRTELPYSSIANHLRSQFQTDTRPLDRRKYVLEVIPIAPTGRVEPRRISLTPLLNARYDQFWESEGAAKRSQYSTTVSAFVNPTMAEIVKVLDEVGNQVTPQDFYHNDGTLPFAQKTGSHRGHNTGKMLDVRTFGIGPSTYEFVDNKSTNATPAQMFVATNTKYADLARLMKMSYRALEFNKTVETGKLKTAAQCQTESGTNPPTCTPSTELTIEKCLIAWIELSTSELSEKEVTCANMRTNVESYEITKQQILDSHSRYRDYILRNRQALLRFKELMQERGLAMPMIMYSFGDNETSREAISLMADIDISTDAIWNLRSLKDGTIPLDENRSATDRISLLTQDGVPIGTSTAHSMLREDKSHTHLDHYRFEEIEK